MSRVFTKNSKSTYKNVKILQRKICRFPLHFLERYAIIESGTDSTPKERRRRA
jgi:hypothetical protein